MIKDKSIYIRNIYYMLSYAFSVLKQKNYESIASEDFEDVTDLCAAILACGTAQHLKQGLYREYVTFNDNLSAMRGKLDINGTIKNQVQNKRVLACEYDELSVDNIYNQIIKCTINYLLKSKTVKKERKDSLKKVLLFFDEISDIDVSSIRWDRLMYQRNNKNYEMLINLCYFVFNSIIQTTWQGKYQMTTFSDEHMNVLFEKFVLAYYKKHHGDLNVAKSAEIKWNISDDTDNNMIRFLPKMQSDIYLKVGERVLIIDTKYYTHTLQVQFDKHTIHSNNLYQIFTYVKNEDVDNSGNVSGVLLYAKTDEDITPDCEFMMGNNKIGVKTLDLNTDFSYIRLQLDKVADEFLYQDVDVVDKR